MFLFNSLSQKQDKFSPLIKQKVSLYVCGITPYDTTHLGHAFTYIFFDTLVRYLQYQKYTVIYTQNVTDINDRDNDILKRAQEQNIPWQKLSQFWTDKFLSDMKSLNWIKPTYYLFASEQIKPMVELIEQILKNGIGYEVNGGVYLDISKIKDFGKLSRFTKNQMMEKAKEFEEDITNPHKKNPLDITLWRPTQKNQAIHIPSFESPWGPGRPGWHVECSAMSTSSLGDQIDIHGGGIDLIYPHHESEIAQSESATKKIPFAKYWLHTGTVHYHGKKMSKSLGNLVLVSDLLKTYSANAIRWLLLSNQWNNLWEFKEEDLKKIELIIEVIENSKPSLNNKQFNNEIIEKFHSYMDDNMNTPKALAFLYKNAEDKTKIETVSYLLNILGFQF